MRWCRDMTENDVLWEAAKVQCDRNSSCWGGAGQVPWGLVRRPSWAWIKLPVPTTSGELSRYAILICYHKAATDQRQPGGHGHQLGEQVRWVKDGGYMGISLPALHFDSCKWLF